MASIYTDLPRIVYIDHVEDSGEYGNANCPHCGAKGRYVYHFRCEDGSRRGAMAGCLKHFTLTWLAQEHRRILDKQRDGLKRFGPGHKLASWDAEILAVIEDYADGAIGMEDAARRVTDQKARMAQWLGARNSHR